VHDPADVLESRLVEVVVGEEALKAAAVVVVSERDAPAGTSSGSSTNTNSGSGSMNRPISQAHAARST
jgi:ethanolamine utilization microcompartment shell protein EutL